MAGNLERWETIFNREKNSYHHYKNEPGNPVSLSSNNAWAILKDKEDNIWVGTYGGGLNLYDPSVNGFIRFEHQPDNPNSLSNNFINSLYQDRKGNIWIGTEGGGLNLFIPSLKRFIRFEHYPDSNSISNNMVKGICEDKQGNIWIGTNAGLNFLNTQTKQFSSYHTSDGLPGDNIMGILEDENEHLWISTNQGLSRFNPLTKTFHNFSVADGLQSNEFKEKAWLKSSTGKMYFGGKNGFNEFHPDSVRETSYIPPLLVTSFQIFNKPVNQFQSPGNEAILTRPVSETSQIEIPYKFSVISFEFASLNYTASEKKQYAYRLTGFDDDWNETGTKRMATYTNLDPGEYIFEVKGLDNEGDWAGNTAKINLTIVPPFWKTWWFKVLGVLAFTGSFFCFYKIRTRIILEKKKDLEYQVKERTAEIREKSREIERMNTLLKAHNEKLEHDVEDVTKARVMQKVLTFEEFKQIFPDDEACYKYVAERKWTGEFNCKKCSNSSFSPWKGPYSRRCTRCNYIESATAFTLFHGQKFSILKAFYMLFLVHENKRITAEELAGTVEISSKSCKVFKRKIIEAVSDKKLNKKDNSWDDLIIPPEAGKRKLLH